MSNSVQTISIINLAITFIPVIAVLIILWKWALEYGKAIYAVFRMLGQLLIIGYFLAYIFESDSALIVTLVLAIMIVASSWIALGTAGKHRIRLYRKAFISIGFGGGLVLLIITEAVLQLEPWYLPQYMIPLAGMIFANSMNTVSLAVERLVSELKIQNDFNRARNIAFHASLIPTINSLFAVGLVSLPGMMTGQILSGVDPLIAARYQIMVMCMIFGASGISTAMFLQLVKNDVTRKALADNV